LKQQQDEDKTKFLTRRLRWIARSLCSDNGSRTKKALEKSQDKLGSSDEEEKLKLQGTSRKTDRIQNANRMDAESQCKLKAEMERSNRRTGGSISRDGF